MKQYKKLIQQVLKQNNLTSNRTDTKTFNSFGGQMCFDVSKRFPILTIKSVNFHAIVIELLWFIKGDTNIQFLVRNNCNIWNEWAYERYLKNKHKFISQEEFVNKIKNCDSFAKQHGDLGPIYGKQWRNFGGIDQLQQAIEDIKNNPTSRRIVVSAWNPLEVKDMALPPCHCFFQFQVLNNSLNLHLYQRSADLFLGVPFNISSYSLLLCMVAQVTGYKPGKFVHSFGDLHIYENHVEQCQLILARECFKLPKLKLDKSIKNLFDFEERHIQLVNYVHHPKVVGKVAV